MPKADDQNLEHNRSAALPVSEISDIMTAPSEADAYANEDWNNDAVLKDQQEADCRLTAVQTGLEIPPSSEFRDGDSGKEMVDIALNTEK